MPNTLSAAWHRRLPGTQVQFAAFLGTTVRVLQRSDWSSLCEIAQRQHDLCGLGGQTRFRGSGIEDRSFRFAPPRQSRWIHAGVPRGGARLDSSAQCSGSYFVGYGATMDIAAMSALIVAWELTFLRAAQDEYVLEEKK